MALGFFRRHQRGVFVVMVLLMVAFLIPTGITQLGQRNEAGQAIGYAGDAKISLGDRQAADSDLQILRDLAAGQRLPRADILQQFMGNEDPALTWALLLVEAKRMGIQATGAQTDDLLKAAGIDPNQPQLARSGLTDKQIRKAAGDWWTILLAFNAAAVATPPSRPELVNEYRRYAEKIDVVHVAFKADDYVKDAEKPTETMIQNQFERCKGVLASPTGAQSDFGFGYMQPDRADVGWLFVNADIAEQAVEPTAAQIRDYWKANRGKITTMPSQPASAPADEVVEPVPVEEFGKAVPQIRQALKRQLAEQKVTALLAQAKDLTQKNAGQVNPFEAVVAAMVHPADELLNKPVGKLPFTHAPLSAVLDQIREVAQITVVFPTGTHGKLTVDPSTDIKVDADWAGKKLSDVLAAVAAQLKLPALEWRTCDQFDSAVFACKPVDLLPISAGRTVSAAEATSQPAGATTMTAAATSAPTANPHLVSLRDLLKDEVLGSAMLSPDAQQGRNVVSIVAETLQAGDKTRRTALIAPGQVFPQAMYVQGKDQGRLLWKLAALAPAEQPERMTDAIRQQVVSDLKVTQAFGLAEKAARDFQGKVNSTSGELDKLAKAGKLDVTRPLPFSRRSLNFQFAVADVEGIGKDPEVIEKLFTLAPADPTPPYKDDPSIVLPLQRQRKALVVQRVGYTPMTAEGFLRGEIGVIPRRVPVQTPEGVRAEFRLVPVNIAALIEESRRQSELGGWFFGPNVQQRLKYKGAQ